MSVHTFSSLARFARRARSARAGRDGGRERCEVCAADLGERHRHVVDRADRRILCACRPCGVSLAGATSGKFRTVPEDVRAVASGALEAADLHALGVPIALAFFFRASTLGRFVGVFPSPAGPTEAELPEDAWRQLAERCSVVGTLEDDIEALLVRCERNGETTAFAVPIDVCYELTAVLRKSWRGIDGGEEARRAIDAFFAGLAERAQRGGSS